MLKGGLNGGPENAESVNFKLHFGCLIEKIINNYMHL